MRIFRNTNPHNPAKADVFQQSQIVGEDFRGRNFQNSPSVREYQHQPVSDIGKFNRKKEGEDDL